MNQTFNKKLIAASVAAALTFGAATVSANQFAFSTLAANQAAVNVPINANAQLAGMAVTFSETSAADIGVNATTLGGLLFGLTTGSAKVNFAPQTTVNNSNLVTLLTTADAENRTAAAANYDSFGRTAVLLASGGAGDVYTFTVPNGSGGTATVVLTSHATTDALTAGGTTGTFNVGGTGIAALINANTILNPYIVAVAGTGSNGYAANTIGIELLKAVDVNVALTTKTNAPQVTADVVAANGSGGAAQTAAGNSQYVGGIIRTKLADGTTANTDANSGLLYVPMHGTGVAVADKITLTNIYADTTGLAAGTGISAYVAGGRSGVTVQTASSGVALATASSASYTSALVSAPTTVPSLAANTTNTLTTVKLSEGVGASFQPGPVVITPSTAALTSNSTLAADASSGIVLGGSTLTVATDTPTASSNTTLKVVKPTGGTVSLYIVTDGSSIATVKLTDTNGITLATAAGTTAVQVTAALLTAINSSSVLGTGAATSPTTTSILIAGNKGAVVGSTVSATATAATAINTTFQTNTSATTAAGIQRYIDSTSGAATYYVGTAGSAATAGSLTFVGELFVPSTATAGTAVNLSLVAPVGSASTATTSSISNVASIVALGTALSYVDSTGLLAIDGSNTTTRAYPVLFAGRNGQALTSNSTQDLVRIKETAATALATGGSTLTIALSSGVAFGKDYNWATGTDSTTSSGTFTISNNVTEWTSATSKLSSVTETITTASGTVDQSDLKLSSLDVADTASGDISVSVSGTGGVTSATVKVASVIDATTSSVSGALQTSVASSSISLPDIVITENKAGAIVADRIAVAIPKTQVSSFTVTNAKVKAYNAAGTDISATMLNNAAGITPTAEATNVANVIFTPSAASNTTIGVVTYKITGLVASLASTATGDLNVTVSGTNTATPLADGSDLSSNNGGKIKKATVKVGSVVSSTNPSYPTAIVADQTKAVIAGLPLVAAGNDQGKPGAVYVAVVYQGSVFFLSSTGTWTPFSTAATVPAYFTGTLGTTSLNVVPTALDLTPIKGAQIVAGYGLGIAGLSNPFDDFIKNARYNVIYTVQ